MVTTLQDQLQLALGDSYLIERELAAGGMSRLFLATERSPPRQAAEELRTRSGLRASPSHGPRAT